MFLLQYTYSADCINFSFPSPPPLPSPPFPVFACGVISCAYAGFESKASIYFSLFNHVSPSYAWTILENNAATACEQCAPFSTKATYPAEETLDAAAATVRPTETTKAAKTTNDVAPTAGKRRRDDPDEKHNNSGKQAINDVCPPPPSSFLPYTGTYCIF